MVEPIALIGTRDPALSAQPTSAENGIPVLRLFHHSLYELKRGVRALFLMTVSRPEGIADGWNAETVVVA